MSRNSYLSHSKPVIFCNKVYIVLLERQYMLKYCFYFTGEQQMRYCIKVIIKGRVQGVFFRVSTQKQAQRLNLCGYAKNLDDGRVEVLAQGEEKNVKTLLKWLHAGPPLAKVEQITWKEQQPSTHTRFLIQ